ncbi:hypothetical protein ACQKGC_01300 [Allorhizobium pseudoryzae]|jgi:divalent metal cation (Fe/Co/Zn/Cd) transporter|uniref:hypothetical protein n=1 Tax=Allorhizobium pseudoryzae TaxID=379684 RepID=UPI003CFDC917
MRHPLVLITATFIAWSLAFLVLYATQATGCHLSAERANAITMLRIVLCGLAILSIAGVVALARYMRRQTFAEASDADRFLRTVGSRVSIAAIVAAIFCFAGVFWLTPC